MPVLKNNNPLSKENYRPVSVLPIISKVFERLMKNKKTLHIKSFFIVIPVSLQERAVIVNML